MVNKNVSENIEYNMISDEEVRPKKCIFCNSTKIIKKTYDYIDLQDLGSISKKRILRHEKISWKCKECGKTFIIDNPKIPKYRRYSFDVIEYAHKRVFEKGDSYSRVAADLFDLHNVSVTPQAIRSWFQDKKEDIMIDLDYFAKIIGPGVTKDDILEVHIMNLDGTFECVSQKKTSAKKGNKAKEEPYWLHLTRLPDGRLAGILVRLKASKK